MRRSAGLAASLFLTALALAGCGHGAVIGSGPGPTPTPVTPTVVNEFSVPTANAQPLGLVEGRDAFVYFTEQNAGNIGQLSSGGAMKDIFPSLHTAGPCFIAMFSFRNRDRLPFRYTWPLLAFFAANIIGATMFLRWHYVIDVFAGFTLASVAALVAPRVTKWEVTRRRRQGLGPLVPPFGAQGAQSAPDGVGRAAA